MTKTYKSKRRKTTGASQDRKVFLAIGAITLVVMLVVFAITASNQQVEVFDNAVLVRPDSPTLGPADAEVTLVEFLDPECESCRAMSASVKEMLDLYEGRIRLVVRYFPLHNNSVLAVATTEAAGLQGMYWEMQELLFEHQSEWGEQSTPQTDLFVQYAQELGLDISQFTTDLNRAEIQERIARDQADGEAVGIDGTPTFFVNGRRLEQLSRASLINAIDAELR